MFVEGREIEAYDELRASDPVHWNPPSERGPGFWALTRYADVKAAASDHARLSSADGTQIVDRKVEGKLASLHNMDDPEHAQLRKVAFPQLRAIKIREWQHAIDASVATLLDEAAERGRFDMVDLIAARLPMLVLSQVMGVPASDGPRMVDWTNRLTSSDPDHQAAGPALGRGARRGDGVLRAAHRGAPPRAAGRPRERARPRHQGRSPADLGGAGRLLHRGRRRRQRDDPAPDRRRHARAARDARLRGTGSSPTPSCSRPRSRRCSAT